MEELLNCLKQSWLSFFYLSTSPCYTEVFLVATLAFLKQRTKQLPHSSQFLNNHSTLGLFLDCPLVHSLTILCSLNGGTHLDRGRQLLMHFGQSLNAAVPCNNASDSHLCVWWRNNTCQIWDDFSLCYEAINHGSQVFFMIILMPNFCRNILFNLEWKISIYIIEKLKIVSERGLVL